MHRRFNLAFAALLVAFSAWCWVRIPTHAAYVLDRGNPDGNKDRTVYAAVPLLVLLVVGASILSRSFADERPGDVAKIPDRRQYAALPEAEQRKVLAVFYAGVDAMMTCLLVLFASLEIAVYRQAVGLENGRLLGVLMGGALVALVAAVIVQNVRVRRRIQESVRSLH